MGAIIEARPVVGCGRCLADHGLHVGGKSRASQHDHGRHPEEELVHPMGSLSTPNHGSTLPSTTASPCHRYDTTILILWVAVFLVVFLLLIKLKAKVLDQRIESANQRLRSQPQDVLPPP